MTSLKILFYRLTGGRPMTFMHSAFTDAVSGALVNYYRDAYGRYWMAEHSWSLFRVKSNFKE